MSERANPTDDPGLVLGDDGIVYEVASDGTRTALGSGGSSSPIGWISIENGNGQTLALTGDSTNHAIEADTIVDQGGTGITWDAGSPSHFLLSDGWFSATATLFFADQPDDAATIVWTAVIGSADGSDPGTQLREIGPAQQSSYQPGGVQALAVSIGAFKAIDGNILGFTGGALRGSSSATDLVFAEMQVVKLSGLT